MKSSRGTVTITVRLSAPGLVLCFALWAAQYTGAIDWPWYCLLAPVWVPLVFFGALAAVGKIFGCRVVWR